MSDESSMQITPVYDPTTLRRTPVSIGDPGTYLIGMRIDIFWADSVFDIYPAYDTQRNGVIKTTHPAYASYPGELRLFRVVDPVMEPGAYCIQVVDRRGKHSAIKVPLEDEWRYTGYDGVKRFNDSGMKDPNHP